jgi:hypothetical protein
MTDPAYPYVWHSRWRHDYGAPVPWFGDGTDRKGQRCRVLARSKRVPAAWPMAGHPPPPPVAGIVWAAPARQGGPAKRSWDTNSALIQFEDGYRVVTSRRGLRRIEGNSE